MRSDPRPSALPHPSALPRRAALGLVAALAATALAGPALAQSPEAPRRVGIVGAGNIGSTLAGFWVKAGYDVLLASRHPERLKEMVEGLGPKARAGTPAQAAAFADTVLLAVPYGAYPQLGRDLGPALAGKTVIDAGNAVRARDGAVHEEVEAHGIGATTRKYFPQARIVRAFNAANYRVFLKNAGRAAPRMAIPIAGDDAAALAQVGRLVTDAGFDPVVVGPLDDARKFAMGSAGFGLDLTAPELRERLGVAR